MLCMMRCQVILEHIWMVKMNDFSMMGHWSKDKFTYELQIEQDDKVIMYPFKSGNMNIQTIETLQQANTIKCPCKEMGDIPGISRLYGEFSEPVEREKAFMDFEGVTEDKDVYKILEKGKVDVVETEMGTTLNFKSDLINGRWLLRTLPNIFNNEFVTGDTMQVLWKPGNHTEMSKPSEQVGEPISMNSEITSVFTEMEQGQFNSIIATVGRFTDAFGVPYIYTEEFLKTLFTNMKRQLDAGEIIGVDKSHSKISKGRMTELHLLGEGQQSKIVGRGIYDGDMSGTTGVSIEAKFQAFWDQTNRAYIPVDGITKRVSLVERPACKICKFIPK